MNGFGPRPTLANELRMKRTTIAREADQRIKKIDRAIGLLELTEAEKVVTEAREVLESA